MEKSIIQSGSEYTQQETSKDISHQRTKINQLEDKNHDKDSLIAEILFDNIRVKKVKWGFLSGLGVESDIRDIVISYFKRMKLRSSLPLQYFIERTGISKSRYYS